MLNVFHLLLALGVGRCKANLPVETRTIAVGNDVTLTCPRLKSDYNSRLFWIRVVPGRWPEFLGGTYSFDYVHVIQNAHITAKQEPENFILLISKVKHSDSGFYYCIKTDQLNMTFLTGEFLRIRGKEPNITAIIQFPLPDQVHPGSPVSLQCSVLFNTQDKTCPTDHQVFWFQAGSDKSEPSFIYAHKNQGNECEQIPEGLSVQKCFYNLSKTVSASDAGTYYCAVATCGVVLFGNGTKLDIEEPNVLDLQKRNSAFIALFIILTASVVVIFILSYIIMKKTSHCSNDDLQNKQRQEGSLVYAAPTFTKRNAAKTERRNKETSEAVYSGLVID